MELSHFPGKGTFQQKGKVGSKKNFPFLGKKSTKNQLKSTKKGKNEKKSTKKRKWENGFKSGVPFREGGKVIFRAYADL